MGSVAACFGGAAKHIGPIDPVSPAACGATNSDLCEVLPEHVGVVTGRVFPLGERALGVGVARGNVLRHRCLGAAAKLITGVACPAPRAGAIQSRVVEIVFIAHVFAVALCRAAQRRAGSERAEPILRAVLVDENKKRLFLRVERCCCVSGAAAHGASAAIGSAGLTRFAGIAGAVSTRVALATIGNTGLARFASIAGAVSARVASATILGATLAGLASVAGAVPARNACFRGCS